MLTGAPTRRVGPDPGKQFAPFSSGRGEFAFASREIGNRKLNSLLPAKGGVPREQKMLKGHLPESFITKYQYEEKSEIGNRRFGPAVSAGGGKRRAGRRPVTREEKWCTGVPHSQETAPP